MNANPTESASHSHVGAVVVAQGSAQLPPSVLQADWHQQEDEEFNRQQESPGWMLRRQKLRNDFSARQSPKKKWQPKRRKLNRCSKSARRFWGRSKRYRLNKKKKKQISKEYGIFTFHNILFFSLLFLPQHAWQCRDDVEEFAHSNIDFS